MDAPTFDLSDHVRDVPLPAPGDEAQLLLATGAFLDATSDASVAPGRPWAPAPAPAARDLFADNLRSHTGELGHAFSALARPVTTARHVRAAWPAIRELFAGQPAPATSLDRVVGPDAPMTGAVLMRANRRSGAIARPG